MDKQSEGRRPFWYEYIAWIGRCMDNSHHNRSEQSEVTVPSGTSMGNQGGEMWWVGNTHRWLMNSLGICGGPAISLALVKPNTNKSKTNP